MSYSTTGKANVRAKSSQSGVFIRNPFPLRHQTDPAQKCLSELGQGTAKLKRSPSVSYVVPDEPRQKAKWNSEEKIALIRHPFRVA